MTSDYCEQAGYSHTDLAAPHWQFACVKSRKDVVRFGLIAVIFWMLYINMGDDDGNTGRMGGASLESKQPSSD